MNDDVTSGDEKYPAPQQEFEHISEILPKVLAAIVQRAAGQQDDRPISGVRVLRRAA